MNLLAETAYGQEILLFVPKSLEERLKKRSEQNIM